MAASHSRIDTLKRNRVLKSPFTQGSLLGARVLSTALALSWMEMKCAFVCTIEIEPCGDVKNVGPLGLESDDAVKTSRILLMNKDRPIAKD